MKDNLNPEAVRNTLGLERRSPWRRKYWLWLFPVLAAGFAMAGLLGARSGKEAPLQFETVPAEIGDLVLTVSATGALEPVNRVDVGTEVSGTLKTVQVDYNDKIRAGDVLATLDTTRLEAKVQQSRAALEVARAKLAEAEASSLEAAGDLERLKTAWNLSGGRLPSRTEIDAAEAALKRTRAAEASARAQILQAEAVLKADETDLSKAVIHAPISGIVLERLVEPGQTVAASLQAPVLFTLAEDLTQMELKVNVDEADVGLVQEGQSARFTVDAYPGREFGAVISSVRFAGLTENGVVTYETLLDVENPELLLRPGMTATAEITVREVEGALLVPNAALRFILPVKEAKGADDEGGLMEKLMPGPPRRFFRSGRRPAEDPAEAAPRVHVLKAGRPVPVELATGITDGINTEIVEGTLQPGDPVIIGVRS